MTDKQLAAKLKTARAKLKQTREGYKTHPNGPNWSPAMDLLDEVIRHLSKPPVPSLGPVLEDGLDILLLAPTHNTDGVPHYPAFDTGFGQAGRWVIAPEKLTVTRQSGAMGGDAFFASGASGLDYWVGHIVPAPVTGRTFRKGERISRIANQAATDHVHWGVDARRLIGKDLLYGRNGNGPDYTYGAPTIGAQLARGSL